jgi:hypothetical protein
MQLAGFIVEESLELLDVQIHITVEVWAVSVVYERNGTRKQQLISFQGGRRANDVLLLLSVL